jgi:hypothetical protein
MDLFSTEASWARLFARLGVRGRLFVLGRVDDYAYLPNSPDPERWLDVAAVFRNRALGAPVTKGVELLNYAAHAGGGGRAGAAGRGGTAGAGGALEYAATLPEAAGRAFAACLDGLEPSPEWLGGRGAAEVEEMVRTFVRLICGDSGLEAIYAGHREADRAYLQRLLA